MKRVDRIVNNTLSGRRPPNSSPVRNSRSVERVVYNHTKNEKAKDVILPPKKARTLPNTTKLISRPTPVPTDKPKYLLSTKTKLLLNASINSPTIQKMGWGQPLTNGIVTPGGKRGRHFSSDENNQNIHGNSTTTTTNGSSSQSSISSSSSSCCSSSFSSTNNSETLTDDMDMNSQNHPHHHFGKRPRDISPFKSNGSGDQQNKNTTDTMLLPDATRLTISDDKDKAGTSSGITPPNYSTIMTEEKFFELGDLKIRTSTPKPLRKGPPTRTYRGPRVAVSSRPRSAVFSPRKMSPTTKHKNNKSKQPSSTGTSSSCTSCTTTSSSSTTSRTTTTTTTSSFSSEEEAGDYEDIDDSNESDSDDSDGSSSDEDITSTSTSTVEDGASSLDIIPPEVSSPEILPAIRPSYFPNVPPYINFCLHNQRTEPLPREIQKHLKWRLSNITPIVVKKTLSNSGFRLLNKTVEWGGHWGRHMKAALFKTSVKDFQKLNHLPGTFQIGRKDRLWRNIQRFMNKFGKEEFGFMPKTFVLPTETKQLKQAWNADKSQLWIIKPPALARGTGIRVVNRWNQVPKKKPMIVQSYIGNPYLINDRKFDLRIYVLVTSFHPLKVYIYNDGLARFAPVKYSNEPKRAGDRFMHLTNYSINKNCELYAKNEDADSSQGHKWTLKTLWRYLLKQGKDVETLWAQIEEIVIKTLICAEDPIVNSTVCYLPNLYNGYELFGFDIILDSELKPWLLEVNISPSLHSSSPLDLAVKGPMIKEVFNICGYHLPPKLSPICKSMLSRSLDVTLDLETPVFDKRIYVNNSLSKEEQVKQKFFKGKFEKRTEYLEQLIETLTPDDIRQLITAEDELSQCYNFYRIYPTTSTHTYTPYFELPRYYNMLFDAWETKYHADRPAAVERLKELCRQKIHLQVPVHAGSMISESLVIEYLERGNKVGLGPEYSLSSPTTIITSSSISHCLEQNGEKVPVGIGIVNLTDSNKKTSTLASPAPEINQTEDKSSMTSITTTAVLDNITNNCCSNRSTTNCLCHPSTNNGGGGGGGDSNSKKTQNSSSSPNSSSSSSSIPSKQVADLPKGICF